MSQILKKIKLPLVLILISVFFILIWKLLGLPSEEVLFDMAKEYFLKYGIITVLIASIIEGMLVVGWYLPGGLVIFLGVILASGNPDRAISSVVATIVGLCIAYTVNYFLGKHGWYKLLVVFGLKGSLEKAEGKFEKYGYKAVILSYWQPNLGALVSTSAGILQASFRKFFFFSTLATILWSVFWGTIAYFLGQKILEYLGMVFFGLMGVWIISIIVGHYLKKDVNISL
ncbi:MAG: rane-associated protein [Patescibacteria group bacterium]|nr:rane-associated protein [Patescibacteria group bacterium]